MSLASDAFWPVPPEMEVGDLPAGEWCTGVDGCRVYTHHGVLVLDEPGEPEVPVVYLDVVDRETGRRTGLVMSTAIVEQVVAMLLREASAAEACPEGQRWRN